MNDNFLIGICLYLFLFGLKLNWDRNQMIDRKTINHRLEALLIYPIVLFSCMLMTKGFAWSGSVTFKAIYYTFVTCGSFAFIWWTFFDGAINTFNPNGKQKFFFAGSEDGKDDAWFDNILQKITYKQRAILKISGCIIFTVWYIFTL